MRWLITGGAGYIGSHVLRSILDAGYDVTVIDNLSNGNRKRIPPTVRFIDGDIRDGDLLLDAMADTDGVIHLAGLKSVSESIKNPLVYYDNNVNGTMSILRAMMYRNVRRLLFSSTAALYAPSDQAIKETDAIQPSSPYAASKFMAERIIADNAQIMGCHYAILRYFNVVGSSHPELEDESRDNLLPRLTRAIRNGNSPEIFGNDYPTRDGTCVRDYVHVQDIADVHALIAQRLEGLHHRVYNVGMGRGVTVGEMIAGSTSMTPIIRSRRPGDHASTVADVTRIAQELGWRARLSIEDVLSRMRD